MWRPDDWDNAWKGAKLDSWQGHRDIYEVGADAMLGALKKDALYTYSEERMELTAVKILEATGFKKGWFVFIPDE